MQVNADKLRKARLRMEGLAEAIAALWSACAEVEGQVVPGGQLELGDEALNRVIRAVDSALTDIRTLDLEVFTASDRTTYHQLRAKDLQGQAVRAVTGPRNNAVHGTEVVDPDLAQALGPVPPYTDRFIAIPKWQPRSKVPASMFQDARGKPNVSYQVAYDTAAAGRPILDTLMDAFAFFERCDPRVVDRDLEGQIRGFPLAPLLLANRYRRLHPDAASEHDWNLQESARITAQPPSGRHRTVSGSVQSDEGWLICGQTVIDDGRSEAFVEPLEQVVADLGMGYRYLVSIQVELQGRADALAVRSMPLDPAQLPSLATDDRWTAWRQLSLDDAAYYERQRNPR